MDGILWISGFVDELEITFNRFLINDEKPILNHTWPIGMYGRAEGKVKEAISLERLSYMAFLHFESDGLGRMEFLKTPGVKLLCSGRFKTEPDRLEQCACRSHFVLGQSSNVAH